MKEKILIEKQKKGSDTFEPIEIYKIQKKRKLIRKKKLQPQIRNIYTQRLENYALLCYNKNTEDSKC